MLAAASARSASDPLALVVFEDETLGTTIAKTLRDKGFRTFTIESILGDTDTLDGLRPEVVVLDVRRNMLGVAKTLVELSKRRAAPPVLLVADADDAIWLAARFRLLTVRSSSNERDLLRAIERSRREERRPRAPS